MLVTVVATFCSVAQPGVCDRDIRITDQATLMQCGGAFGEQAISKWMGESLKYRTGWRLSKWGCVIGGQRGREA